MKINKEEINIPKPSIEEVEKYLEKWKHNKEYCNKEEVLNKLFFEICPKNIDIKDILLKASTLNDFYSTNIFSIYLVAKHICDDVTDIDSRLKKGDETIVGEIQAVTIKNDKPINFYSFASKYCSHHNPEEYPIYDSYVDEVLWYFRKHGFSNFLRKDLQDYVKFKGIILEFRDKYGLNNYTLKQIDQYLWQLGKEYFPKQIKIDTKRCRIRQFKDSDVDELYLILSNPKVMEYIEEPFTLESTKEFLNKNALSYPQRVFALEHKENKKLIGHVIFHEYDKNSYEIGFILNQNYWGQGIANEVTKSLIDYAKNKNIHSLIIECDKRQLATQKIAKNNNFKLISSEDLLVYKLIL